MAQTSEKSGLIDTAILVDYLRLFSPAQEFLDALKQPSASAVTAMEIIQGSRNKRELQTSLTFLENFCIIQINSKISEKANSLMKEYRLKYDLSIPDALIGATAIVHNKALITKNVKDFRFMKALLVKEPY